MSVFSPNTGKYEPEKSPYLDTFHAVSCGGNAARIRTTVIGKTNFHSARIISNWDFQFLKSFNQWELLFSFTYFLFLEGDKLLKLSNFMKMK